MAELLGTFTLAALVVVIYILPTIIAARRRHKNFMPILIINLIFAATVIGWILCLAWSFSSNTHKDETQDGSAEA